MPQILEGIRSASELSDPDPIFFITGFESATFLPDPYQIFILLFFSFGQLSF